MSYNFAKQVRLIGWDASLRQAKNLNIDFIDLYVSVFGRMPRKL